VEPELIMWNEFRWHQLESAICGDIYAELRAGANAQLASHRLWDSRAALFIHHQKAKRFSTHWSLPWP